MKSSEEWRKRFNTPQHSGNSQEITVGNGWNCYTRTQIMLAGKGMKPETRKGNKPPKGFQVIQIHSQTKINMR